MNTVRSILALTALATSVACAKERIPTNYDRVALNETEALMEEAKAVDAEYSVKPIRVILGAREYVIPANYFGPKRKSSPPVFDASKSYFGFYLFIPNYDGYTKDNWQDKLDRRLIHVLQVKAVDKAAIVHFSDGRAGPVSPAAYGEPKAQFENARRLLEDHPFTNAHGLEGYRPKHRQVEVTWVGHRSNGEFFFFRCNLAPQDPARRGIPNPLCNVRYYSEKEDLFVAYRYSNDHLPLWQQIDDAIWQKLRSWRVR